MPKKISSSLLYLILFVLPLKGLGQTSSHDSTQDFQVPESYVERMQKKSNVLELSLKESIRMALSNNLEIEIENFNEELNKEQVLKIKGHYDPTMSFTVGWTARETPTTSTLQAGRGITVNELDGFTFDSSLVQNVGGGGTLNLNFQNGRNFTNSLFQFINPRYDSSFNISFTQPLWRGFFQNGTRRQIQILNLDTKISDTQFKQRVVEVIQQLQNQYWELVYAVANYETQRKSVELAIIQYQDNKKRVDIGVMAPIEITSSKAEVARRDQTLIQSEVQIINAQNGLKRLLASDPQASIWDLIIIPTDSPRLRNVSSTLRQSLDTALRNRPELQRIQLQIEQNEINRKFYTMEGKPNVNLRTNFGTVGAAGQVFQTLMLDFDGDGIPDASGGKTPNTSDPRYGNFSTAWGQLAHFDFHNWGLFLDVQIPIRNRANAADLATVAIRQRQFESTMKNQQHLIIVEVRNAYETITTRKKSMEAARLARQLAEEQLDGETKRFQAGLSTNFEVLRFQRDLAENQVSELRAEVDYELAVTALHRAMNTIVEEQDIILAKEVN